MIIPDLQDPNIDDSVTTKYSATIEASATTKESGSSHAFAPPAGPIMQR